MFLQPEPCARIANPAQSAATLRHLGRWVNRRDVHWVGLDVRRSPESTRQSLTRAPYRAVTCGFPSRCPSSSGAVAPHRRAEMATRSRQDPSKRKSEGRAKRTAKRREWCAQAEGVGFEPTEACTSQLFKSCAFVRSPIPPGGSC